MEAIGSVMQWQWALKYAFSWITYGLNALSCAKWIYEIFLVKSLKCVQNIHGNQSLGLTLKYR